MNEIQLTVLGELTQEMNLSPKIVETSMKHLENLEGQK